MANPTGQHRYVNMTSKMAQSLLQNDLLGVKQFLHWVAELLQNNSFNNKNNNNNKNTWEGFTRTL